MRVIQRITVTRWHGLHDRVRRFGHSCAEHGRPHDGVQHGHRGRRTRGFGGGGREDARQPSAPVASARTLASSWRPQRHSATRLALEGSPRPIALHATAQAHIALLEAHRSSGWRALLRRGGWLVHRRVLWQPRQFRRSQPRALRQARHPSGLRVILPGGDGRLRSAAPDPNVLSRDFAPGANA